MEKINRRLASGEKEEYMEEQITLRAARNNAGYTLEDVSIILMVSINTLSSWENNKTLPDTSEFERMCRLYHRHPGSVILPKKLTNG